MIGDGFHASGGYEPYGTPADVVGTFGQPFRFTGEMRDANALQYHRARYYAVGTASWLSSDEYEGNYENPVSLNSYSWVHGNPINLVDPDGFAPLCQIDICQNADIDFGIKKAIGCFETPRDCTCYSTSTMRGFCQNETISDCNGPRSVSSYGQDAVNIVLANSDELECMTRWIEREVGTLSGTGTYDQAKAIAFVILNRLALTINLDRGGIRTINTTAVYSNICHSQIQPGYTSQNPEAQRAIGDALASYARSYRTTADPTDGSLQWRHYPNCIVAHRGCNDEWEPECGYPKDSVCLRTRLDTTGRAIPDESAETFFERHMRWAREYERRNSGRNFFPPFVTTASEARLFEGRLYQLGSLTVFNRNTADRSANLYVQLGILGP